MHSASVHVRVRNTRFFSMPGLAARTLRHALSLLAVTGVATSAVAAESPKLILHGQTDIEIPLESSSAITVNANGDLEAQCRDGNCPQGSGGGGSAVVATLVPSATEITVGGSFSLQWNSQNAEICRGLGPSSISGWSSQALATSGSKSLSLPVGDYLFSLRCYGLGGTADIQTTLVKVVQGTGTPPPTGNYCSEYYDGSTAARTTPEHASFTAYGLTAVQAEWGEVFGVPAGATQSEKKVLPGNFLRPTAGRYLAIPFVLTSDTDENLSNIGIQWIEGGYYGSQLIPAVKSGPTVFTVSPCPGDFRKSNNLAADPYERSICRRTTPSTQGSNLSISSQASRSGACYAPKGKLMYLNIATYDMSRTSLPAQTTCGSSETCGVSVQID